MSATDTSSRPTEEAKAVAGSSQDDADSILSRIGEQGTGYPDANGTLEASVTSVDYTTHSSPDGSKEYPVIHLFCRTDDDNEQNDEEIIIHGFRPYFYAPSRMAGRVKDHPDVEELEENVSDGIRGEELTRIYTETPGDVRDVRDEFVERQPDGSEAEYHFEADIRFPNRFLIDKDIRSGVRVPERRDDNGRIIVPVEEVEPVEKSAEPRVHAFDIEVEDRNGFPEDGEEPIICITSYDSFRDQYIIWVYDAPEGGVDSPEDLPGYDPLVEDELDYRINVFDEEGEMLRAYISYIQNTNPDVLTAWNIDFDANYLIDRLNQLKYDVDQKLDPDELSRVGEAWSSNWGATIKGRVVFDLLEAYKRTKFSELDSYKLEKVGQKELDAGKEHYDGDLGDLWENDPERLLEYNLRDVELMVELDRKQDITSFWQEVAEFVGCQLDDAPIPSDAVDMYVLHKVHGRFVLPSQRQAESEDYEGGAVFEPISGVVENVTVLDLKSLYPMCMFTINASPETKVDPEEYDGETYVAPNGVHFRKQPDGIIREIIDELLSEREEKKALRNEHEPGTDEYDNFDRQQAAIKVVMNSTYGVLGWERFRLYDKEMGAAVTATGREVINFTEQVVEQEFGQEITYGDTDSVMYQIPDIDAKEDLIEKAFEHEEIINDRYDDFAKQELNADEHRFQIEFEKLYRRFFQAGKKKRYAGHIIWKEGKDVDKVDITGFEAKRSDQPDITVDVQTETLKKIVYGEDEDEIRSYLNDIITDFRNGEYSVDDIGIPGGIGKKLDNYDTPTAHVRGAKYSNLLLGTNFGKASKPKRVYLRKIDHTFFEENDIEVESAEDQQLLAEFKRDPDVISFEHPSQVPDEFKVDWDKMLNKTLKGSISRVINAIDIDWDEVRSGQTQRGIGEFV